MRAPLLSQEGKNENSGAEKLIRKEKERGRGRAKGKLSTAVAFVRFCRSVSSYYSFLFSFPLSFSFVFFSCFEEKKTTACALFDFDFLIAAFLLGLIDPSPLVLLCCFPSSFHFRLLVFSLSFLLLSDSICCFMSLFCLFVVVFVFFLSVLVSP